MPTLKDQTAHTREVTTINLNLLSKFLMMILKLKFAYHILKIYLKIYKVDQITQQKELTKFLSWIMYSFPECLEKDFFM